MADDAHEQQRVARATTRAAGRGARPARGTAGRCRPDRDERGRGFGHLDRRESRRAPSRRGSRAAASPPTRGSSTPANAIAAAAIRRVRRRARGRVAGRRPGHRARMLARPRRAATHGRTRSRAAMRSSHVRSGGRARRATAGRADSAPASSSTHEHRSALDEHRREAAAWLGRDRRPGPRSRSSRRTSRRRDRSAPGRRVCAVIEPDAARRPRA